MYRLNNVFFVFLSFFFFTSTPKTYNLKIFAWHKIEIFTGKLDFSKLIFLNSFKLLKYIYMIINLLRLANM